MLILIFLAASFFKTAEPMNLGEYWAFQSLRPSAALPSTGLSRTLHTPFANSSPVEFKCRIMGKKWRPYCGPASFRSTASVEVKNSPAPVQSVDVLRTNLTSEDPLNSLQQDCMYTIGMESHYRSTSVRETSDTNSRTCSRTSTRGEPVAHLLE